MARSLKSAKINAGWSQFLLLHWVVTVAFSATGIKAFQSPIFGNQLVVPPTTATSTTLFSSTVIPPSSSSPVQLLSESLLAALRKPSKTLTVGLELDASLSSTTGRGGSEAVESLSMQLRKLRTSTLWTSDLIIAAALAKEQATARGNFPEPCPVILRCCSSSQEGESTKESAPFATQVEAAAKAGVDAVVVPASRIIGEDINALLGKLSEYEMGVIFEIHSPEDVRNIFTLQNEAGLLADQTVAFLVQANSEHRDAILDAITESSVRNPIVLASMPAMQPLNEEIASSRALQKRGVHGIVLERAIVGDGEDMEYCAFAVEGLTQKRSSTFNMTGLTGTTNGHFGGVKSSVARTWRRTKKYDEKQK